MKTYHANKTTTIMGNHKNYKGGLFMKRNKELLEQEVTRLLERLSDLEPGDDEYMAVCDRLAKLYDLDISADKAEADIELKKTQKEASEADKELKKSQKGSEIVRLENERKAERNKLITGIAGVAVSSITTLIMFKTGLKFEETGAISSFFLRTLINKKMK